ncbi:MAG: RagB/SusD family nutrient uptake outer membrane protein, partial [Bacteroidales bacterium]|nr:RagB/SusD family nutrient uptake outer membrane protein [Bacteroidales bacterium]
MRKSFLYTIIAAAFALVACEEMYLPTKDKVSDDDIFSSASSMQVYMARMYSYLPIEDFKYLAEWGVEYNSWLGSFGMEGTGESMNRDCASSFTGERTTYWSNAFTLIHDANHLIEVVPNYESTLGSEVANEAMGQGYFVRAFTFYAMARRFGGIPLVTKTIEYNREDPSTMEVARSSEEETWDQVMADFQKAAELLPVVPSAKGYANKYTAYACLAEAMNYAGCVAKYNQTIQEYKNPKVGEKTGVRVIGFDPDKWQAASKRYFEAAFKAANTVIKSGQYSLYRANSDKYQNMVDMWRDDSSSENIWVRYYSYPTVTHGLDSYSS